jgi:hypothetical protein
VRNIVRKAPAAPCWLPVLLLLTITAENTADAQERPTLSWSTYLGGTAPETKLADIEADSSGHVWIAGSTVSADYPVQSGEPPAASEGPNFILDAFLSRLTPDGLLDRSGYGGEPLSDELVEDLAVGPEGALWQAGWSDSAEDVEVLVDRTTADGTVGGSFDLFSGEGSDAAFAITTDAQGNAWIAGTSGSASFAGAPSNGSPVGNYVLKLDPAAGFQQLLRLPALPGAPQAIAVDPSGFLYVAGGQAGAGVPDSDSNVWVLKLDATGHVLWQVTLGGSAQELPTGIEVDAAGRVWVAGWTASPEFPVLGGQPYAGSRDAFLVRLTGGGVLAASTLLGGTGRDEAHDLALDGNGVPYLAGLSTSVDFPLLGSIAEACGDSCGGTNAFAASFHPSDLWLTFSTLIGGTTEDEAHGVAVDPAGSSLWVAGLTDSSDFPVLNAFQDQLAGAADAFVVRIGLTPNQPPSCAAVVPRPNRIWPPDDKFRSIAIYGVTDPEGDPVALTVLSIHQDEPLTVAGRSDGLGVGSAIPRVRASRQEGGNGRVYHVRYQADDGRGGSCTGSLRICVPPMMPGSPTCTDGGPQVDSSGG